MAHVAEHLLDIYSVWLHAADRPKAWRTLCEQIDSLDRDAVNSVGFTSIDIDGPTNMPHVSIWINAKRCDGHESALVETYTHESAHAAGMILDHFGQAYGGNSEAFAYLAGWIAGWLWRSLRGNQ